MSHAVQLSDESVLAIPAHVLSRKAAGETVLLNLDNEEYYGLDGIGSRLWDLIESGTMYGHLVEALLTEYEVGRDTLDADLRRLLTDLSENGLLLVENG